ncbi:MAG: ribosomal-protein-alanine N-acetyltransferase [Ruminococcaceae bacterium]|nr:ribosomal-protein-alanine N-acetyltransferase [Oscillospiraceae bacterium]
MKTAILEEAHLAAAHELERLCFTNPWSEDALTHLLQEGNFGAVVLVGETVAAYAGLVVALDEGEITNVATHPDHRRCGYARDLLRFLLAEAARRGLCRVTLEVRESNCAARSLYDSLGFAPCGKRKNFYSHPREDALILEKML